MNTRQLNPELFTERLRLEPQLGSHAQVMMHVLSDARSHEFIPSDPPKDEAKLRERFEKLESRLSPDGAEYWLNWIVFLAEQALGTVAIGTAAIGTVVIGTVQASVYPEIKCADIAYLFHPDSWGKSYAREATQRMLAYLRNDLAVQTFTASVDTRNLASQRLLESLGFTQTNYVENADEFKGSVSHEYVYTLSY
jgi:[ribosomal protein S5]-alanine N-acetyltransferase